ncbi:signal peptidase II [Candidatus Gracilibacteria bacterium]|nr:signal peptidase II [Candidatus Gracilibacteria bacterium]
MIFPLTALFIFLDLFTKNLAQKFLQNSNFDLIFGAKFMLKFNEGIAFSIPLTGILQIVLSCALLGFLIFYTWKNWDLSHKIEVFSFSLIIGGALGNLYERIFFGKVTDFISVFSWFPTFNLADSFIFIGVCLALRVELRNEKVKNNAK